VRVPRATYRVQMNGEFRFVDAAGIVPYLDRLGVSDLYCSPYFEARAGSTHGYDVVDHNRLNDEIGTDEEYERLVGALREHGMGQLLDIVPNHMGVGPDNSWWMSVLKHGPASPHAGFFDIDWSPVGRNELRGKVLLPVLGDHYRNVLERGELELRFDREEGSFSVRYYEHRFPLDPKTYPMILGDLEDLPEDEHSLELESLVTAFEKLPGQEETGEEAVAERARDSRVNEGRLKRLCAESEAVRRAVEDRVAGINGRDGEPESFEWLHRILEEQAYRLAYWRVASDEINYRRFFAINDLAGIRQEEPEVFEATHRLVLDLLRQGKVNGLRIDHVDGLYDPAGYLRRLQEAAGEALGSGDEEAVYLLVEKILAHHERLPTDWPVAGTTGYEFTNQVNGLFVDPDGEAPLDRLYRRFTGEGEPFAEILYRAKRRVMREELASELGILVRRLLRLSEGLLGHRRQYDFTVNVLRDALTETVAAFPVYRTYVTGDSISEADERYVDWAISQGRKRSGAADTTVFDFLRDVLLLRAEGSEGYRRAVLGFVMKLQQYTGPVMAKGFEDTALYAYNRLASLNEVGGDPERFGYSVAAFHHLNGERARDWPHSMLTTSTHDTKRGEDVRARISALSEIPNEWRARVARWARMARSRRVEVDGELAPSRGDEYLLYQTLVGAWPLGDPDEEGLAEFRGRIGAYMEKAMREADVHTSWTKVNEEYEGAVSGFVEALLAPGPNLFLDDLVPFARKVARLGALNSLSQTLLKLTAPGVPDVYQGNELWDLSLVDPDNRRPVDYRLRERLLGELETLDPVEASVLLEDGAWQDGRPKLYLTWKALGLRRERPELFERGEYVPLEAEGERADHLVAFARVSGDDAVVVVAPRLFAGLPGEDGTLLPDARALPGASVVLPEGLAGREYRSVLTGGSVRAEGTLPVADLLGGFPVALLAAV